LRKWKTRPLESPRQRVYRYDRDGNLVLTLKPQWTSGSGNVEAAAYDELNRKWLSIGGGLSSTFVGDIAHADLGTFLQAGTIPQSSTFVAVAETRYARSTIARTIDPENKQTTYQYDGFNRVIQVHEPMGRTVFESWDPDNNRVEVRVDGNNGHGGVSTLARQFSKFDEQNRVFQTDLLRIPVANAEPTPDGPLTPGDFLVTTRQRFDSMGRITKSVDDNQHVRTFQFDGLGRRTRETDPAGNFTIYRYDGNGNTIELEEHEFTPALVEEIRTTYRFYDNLDRLVAEANAAGETRRIAYDSRSNPVFVSDANGAVNSTLTTLDTYGEHANLPALAINDHGNTRTFAYDLESRLTEESKKVRLGGTGSGAVQATINLQTKYNLNGRVIEQRDGKNNVTTFNYDDLDRETASNYADGSTRTNDQYDRNGLVLQSTDANGTVTTNAYDDLLHLAGRRVHPGAGVAGTTSEQYVFDALGRLAVGTDDDSTVVRWYDTMSYTLIEDLNGTRTIMRFDGKGNNTDRLYPGGRAVDINYDSLDRPSAVRDNVFGTIANYEYTGFSRVASREYPANGMRWDIQYDSARRPIASTHGSSGGGGTIDDRSFTWDRESNRLSRHNALDGVDHTYSYDSLDRLLSASRTVLQPGAISYRMDKAGNRNLATGSWNPGTYAFVGTDGPVHQYTTTPFDQRAYDGNGNLTQTSALPAQGGGVLADAEYDYRNQLIKTTTGTTTTVYTYDVLGRRIGKYLNLPTGNQEVHYYYAGERVCEERDAAGRVLATYVHGYYIDEILTMERDADGDGTPEDYFYHSDDQYNVVALTDLGGSVVERYDYGDYGEVLDGATYLPLAHSAVGNPYLFTGRERDEETGWYYYRTRYFDPYAGRFLSRDSIGIWGIRLRSGTATPIAGTTPGLEWTPSVRRGLESSTASSSERNGSRRG
jgi:RHS repeat-associated protein